MSKVIGSSLCHLKIWFEEMVSGSRYSVRNCEAGEDLLLGAALGPSLLRWAPNGQRDPLRALQLQ